MQCCPDRARGFTLIEVMTAGVILSVLVLGLTEVWSVAGARSIDSTVRQKAVFVLNGEMERLSALYNLTGFGDAVVQDTTGYGLPAPYPEPRAVYRTDANNFMPPVTGLFVVNTAAAFLLGADAQVLLDGAAGSAERNYVWIDRDRGIMGRLSWSEVDLPTGSQAGGASGLCLDYSGGTAGDNCREISLYLEYPFRLVGTVPTADPDGTDIMPLKTIVGRRS